LYKLQDNNCFRTLGQSVQRAPDAEMQRRRDCWGTYSFSFDIPHIVHVATVESSHGDN